MRAYKLEDPVGFAARKRRKEEDKFIRWNYGQMPAMDIGKILGLTETTVVSRAKGMGLNSRRGADVRRKIDRVVVKQMIEDGYSATEISERLGCGRLTIREMAVNEFMETTVEKLRLNGIRARDYGKRAIEVDVPRRSRG